MQPLVFIAVLVASASACRNDADCTGLCPGLAPDSCNVDTHECQCQMRLHKETSDLRTDGHTKLDADAACILCEFIMTTLSDVLQENASRIDIQYAFDFICSLMPDTISNECTAFVNTYTSLIITVLVNDIADPHEVCHTIKVCQSADRRQVGVSSSDKCTSDQDCTLPCPHHEVGHCGPKRVCECVPACMYAPPSRCFLPCPMGMVGKCDSDGYCRCHPQMASRSMYDDTKCVICRFAMNVLDDWLMENATAKDVEGVLDVVCSLMSDTIAKECAEFVRTYEPIVIQLLVNDIAPDQICLKIRACASTHDHGHAVRPVLGEAYPDNRTP